MGGRDDKSRPAKFLTSVHPVHPVILSMPSILLSCLTPGSIRVIGVHPRPDSTVPMSDALQHSLERA